jgi:hypothetical protein
MDINENKKMATYSLHVLHPHPQGATRAVLVWRDSVTGRKKWEEITQEQYGNLGNPPIKPQTFNGTDEEWARAWTTNEAQAEIRALYDTPTGDPIPGSMLDVGNGRVIIFTDSRENGKLIKLDSSDYTGLAPNITQTKSIGIVGVDISGGILTYPS